MKEKTIIIDNKKTSLREGYEPIDLNYGADSYSLVVEETKQKYKIINDFSSNKKLEELEDTTDTIKENIYFAEEIFDDEDDIYSYVTNDSLLKKDSYRSIFDIGETINKAMLSRGYKTSIGLSLLASMQFSKLLYLPLAGDQKQFVTDLFKTLDNPIFILSSDVKRQDNYLAYEESVYKAIDLAKKNRNKPVFIYIDNLKSKDFFDYFHHFYAYIDNPNGDNYLTALGKSISLPQNLYFIFSLEDKEIPCDISRRIFRYVSYLEATFQQVEPSANKEVVVLSLEEIRSSIREASETYSIKEEIWKKFDNLVEVIHEVNGFILQNKIARRLEDYAIAYFTSPLETLEVMDRVISNNFIHEAIITTKPNLYTTTHDLFKAIDNSFGVGSLPLTCQIIKDYLSLFDKGGNRIHE